ncbi:MAG: EFR1 family ferrodoxin [Muribaculaceae bacterium]
MIFCFSATGNSLWAAQCLAQATGEHIVDIPTAIDHTEFNYSLRSGERIGWVFPIHSWGIPPLVESFIDKVSFDSITGTTYCYMLATCGDDCGLAAQMLADRLRGISLSAAFSLQMPNTYILLPGFNVDSPQLETSKLSAAQIRIAEIAEAIIDHRHSWQVIEGSCAWLKSRVLRPLFYRFLVRDSKFNVDADRCHGCGLCRKVCPLHNITPDAHGRPQWHGNCTTCLACLHRCPSRAINYGNATKLKGRYHHP